MQTIVAIALQRPMSGFFVPPRNESNQIVLNSNGMNFVRVNYGNDELMFLIDTGASISVISNACLRKNEIVDVSNKININGISGSTRTLGTSNVTFRIGNGLLNHKFHVVKNFDLKLHGILGTDFFIEYSAVIDYEKFSFSFVQNENIIKVNLMSKHNNYITVPPRCEVLQYCSCDEEDECVVLPEELCEGVFVGSTIVKPQNKTILVRILNINEKEVKLRNFKPRTDKFYNYDTCKYLNNPISVDRVDKLLDILNFKSLNREEKTSIEKICAKFADVFQLDTDPLTVSNICKQKIRLQDDSPVYIKPYRLPYSQKEEINKQISKMLDDGIIEPAISEWSSPLLIVPKKSLAGEKKWRVVLDYRQLNNRIKTDKFPLPCIDEILNALSGAVYFTHLDLYQGYYQIELDSKSRPYTAFSTDRGQFQMTRLPMGLKISPNSFARAMTLAMSGLNYSNCFIYLDDLIIFGNNLVNHNQNLVKVLQRLRQVNLKLNPTKCDFLKKEILYLGHTISSNGISPDPQKIDVMMNYPVPTNGNETKRFVAFANYYRKFIKNFAELAGPLNFLSKKGVTFNWTHECQKAFESLKQALMKPPVLQYPDFSENNKFILRTDASGYALGAVLLNSNDKPVAYASRSLNKAEINYCTIEKELLSIVWAVKKFRPYLFGRKFEIHTDHRPLIYLFGMSNPSSRLTKFRLVLEEYDFSVHYVRGKDNVVADALSRIKIDVDELINLKKTSESIAVITRAQAKNNKNDRDIVLNNTNSNRIDHPGVVELLKFPPESVELCLKSKLEADILVQQDSTHRFDILHNLIYDKDLKIIYVSIDYLPGYALGAILGNLEILSDKYSIPELVIIKNKNNEKLVNMLTGAPNEVKNSRLKICIIKDIQRITQKEVQQLVLNDFHMLPTGGHAGINRMFNNIKKYYYWPKLRADVENFVRRCDNCQKCKYSNLRKQPMSITTTATSAFQKIFLDLVGPLELDENGNRYILTLQCELSKYVEGYSLPNKEANTVAKSFVENFILRYGIPEQIVTDQGTEFINSIFKEICSLLKIKQLCSTAYHHQTLGALENSHKGLGAYLRIYAADNRNNWSSWVPYWCFMYNTTVHTETHYTPFELVFGKTCVLPSNLINRIEPIYNFEDYPKELKYRLQTACYDARNNLLASKHKRKELYDRNSKVIKFLVGDKVLLRNTSLSKSDPIFKGPYVVVEDTDPNVRIKIDNKVVEVHKNRVKRYYNK